MDEIRQHANNLREAFKSFPNGELSQEMKDKLIESAIALLEGIALDLRRIAEQTSCG